MHAYITTCSKEKSTILGEIPMLDRYLSERIDNLFIKSKEDNVTFFVLSGKYGLLSPSNKIPWYDQILEKNQVSEMIIKVKHQFLAYGITDITLFANPAWENYIQVIQEVCILTNSSFTLKKLD